MPDEANKDKINEAVKESVIKSMTQNELIDALLRLNGIDPDSTVENEDGNGSSAFSFLEAHIMGALDEIED